MSANNVHFNLSFDDSSDGESLCITQTPKENRGEVNSAQAEDDLNCELEDLMDTTTDSAIGSVIDIVEFANENRSILDKSFGPNNFPEKVDFHQHKYSPAVEDISVCNFSFNNIFNLMKS